MFLNINDLLAEAKGKEKLYNDIARILSSDLNICSAELILIILHVIFKLKEKGEIKNDIQI